MTTGGHFLFRHLEQLLPGVIDKRYRNQPYENGQAIPTMVDLEAGSSEVVRQLFNEVGDAIVMGDEATDIPVVDISGDEDRYKVLMVTSSFSYNFNQERTMQKAEERGDLSISDRSMRATSRVIASKANRLAVYGSTKLGIDGFANNSNVLTVDETTIDFFDRANTTVDAIASWFIEKPMEIAKASNLNFYPNRVDVSHDLMAELQSRRVGDGTMSLYTYILQNSAYLEQINGRIELQSDRLESNGVETAGTGHDRAVFYTYDEEAIERHIEPLGMMPEERRNGRVIFPMFMCVTPTIVNFPGSMGYYTYDAKA